MKQCQKCRQSKTLEWFFRNRSTRDGFSHYCKPCHSAVVKRSNARPAALAAHAELQKRYREANADKRAETVRKYNGGDTAKATRKRFFQTEKGKAQMRAHAAVHKAIRAGVLVRPTACEVCGTPCRPDGHHHLGYAVGHRLSVKWLCKPCHHLEDR